jgi:GntR family transcriptional regulator of vanillate catabolism
MLMRDHVASVKSSLIRSLASPAAVQAATKTARRLRR